MARPPFYRPGSIDRYQMCTRKRRYRTEDQARAVNKGQRPYKCPHCQGWHLTSKPLRKEP